MPASRGSGGVSTSSASASVSLPWFPGASTAATPPATPAPAPAPAPASAGRETGDSAPSSPSSPAPTPASPSPSPAEAQPQRPSAVTAASHSAPRASTTASTSASPTSASTSTATSPLPPASTSSSSGTQSRPGLLARLGSSLNLPLPSPLRNRNRNVTDFHVLCDEPHRKYSAGDHVHGTVILVVVKPVRITHLVVTLHGFVRVLRDPAGAAKVRNAVTLPQGGSSSRPQYHGNGFASLFQDEQVLSGEGRLDPGRYEFGFDLVFPDKGLPSSIDFERGTISYMVTATLTRPVSMAATMTCERKVMLAERIDVGLLPPPPPRTIFLEPISKRTKRKKSSMALDKGSLATPEPVDVVPEPDTREPYPTPTATEDASAREYPISDQQSERRGAAASSDVQSEISGESGRSISTAMSRSDTAQLTQIGSTGLTTAQQAVNDKTITASIELLRGGCLPGDAVSVRVTVQHIKQVKSMTGVIVTLFRQGRIDSSPPSQLFRDMLTREDARRLQREDIYPRSRTGLGGLSLSSAGSISVFRKDLDQTTAPLIIDPNTMQASVTVPVKIPDDSFPTIKGVPGDMISFKYQVEVIVDLGGKLSGHFPSRKTSRFGGTFSSSATDQSISMFSQRRGAQIEIMDTAPLRRQKGIVCVTIESIVGTVDSSGARRLIKLSSSSKTLDNGESDDELSFIPTPTRYEEIDRHNSHSHRLPPQEYFPPHTNQRRPSHSRPPPSHPSYTQLNHHELAPSYTPPPPQLPDQSNLSEKDRIRQAEQRLLPSRPPAGPSSPHEDDIYDAQATPRPPYAGNSGEEDNPGPSAPTEEELTAAVSPLADAGEDKQELERRRLMQEASAPPEFPEDMVRRGGPGRAPREEDLAVDAEPTAPMLDEDGDHSAGYGAGAGPSGSARTDGIREHDDGEQLPAYQR